MKKVKYFIVPLLVCILMITGCGKKKEENNQNNNSTTTTTVAKVETVEMNVEEKNNRLYVNGNMVDFYTDSEISEKYLNSDDLYTNNTQYSYEKIDDVVFVQITFDDLQQLNYFVDTNGKIIKKVNGKNADIELSINDSLYIDTVVVDKVNNNELYLRVHSLSHLTTAALCSIKDDVNRINNVYWYIDKITYINGNFNLEKAIEKETFKDAINKENLDCSFIQKID